MMAKCFNCGYAYPCTLNKKGFEKFGHRFVCLSCMEHFYKTGHWPNVEAKP